jgi:DNA-binding NarL/FixJ family response regulator
MPESPDGSEPAAPSLPALIKVAIVEDRREIRDALSMLINRAEGFRCLGVYRTMEQALDRIDRERPDVVLCDIGLPGISGIEGVRLLKERYPNILLMMLTVYEDEERIFDALCAGASGYLLKRTSPATLIESLKEALQGGAPLSPEVARRVVTLFRDMRPPARAEYDLTPHELRLLKLLVEGHNYKTAAAELGVSFHAIHFHMRSIYSKLQVHSKSEAVSKALRTRII